MTWAIKFQIKDGNRVRKRHQRERLKDGGDRMMLDKQSNVSTVRIDGARRLTEPADTVSVGILVWPAVSDDRRGVAFGQGLDLRGGYDAVERSSIAETFNFG